MTPFKMSADDRWVIRFERRGGRWVLAPVRGSGPWYMLFEWAVVTAAACAILMGGLFAGLYQARPDFDRQSRAFADASVEAIASSLSTGELFVRASPDFIDSASDASYADFHRLAALGPGSVNQGCRGAARVQPFGVYSVLTAQYSCELQAKGKRAVLVLSLGRDLNDWKITGFYVSPPQPIAGWRAGGDEFSVGHRVAAVASPSESQGA
jgi:hypothetical protein